MRLRAALATLAGKLAGALSRLTGRGGGTAVSGLVSVAIDPAYVTRALGDLGRVAFITGTNGKTTTTALVAAALRSDRRAVLGNPTGSNLERGLASALVARARLDGRIVGAADATGVFEIDEWAYASLAPRVTPDVLVLLNLFRDQLDRYGEVDRIAASWREALEHGAGKTQLIANADDPLVVTVARAHPGPVLYFGLDGGPSRDAPEEWADVRRCPRCDARLEYSRVTYAHLGDYRCPAGDLERPEPDVRVTDVRSRGLHGSDVAVSADGWTGAARISLPGLYNAYNVAAAVAAAHALDVPPERSLAAIQAADPAFGRAETIAAGDTSLQLLLIKNPAGANQTLEMLAGEPGPLDTLILLNDGVADGQDVSWIWDVDFERLRPRRLTLGGRRAGDLALRLKYAGVGGTGTTTIAPGIAAPLDAALAASHGRLVALATYTAMLDLRAECARRGWTSPFWSGGPE